uniref:Germinal-center associated nuclear protein n=1 Tax=Esox lucius TaxID=8010 RepID=A0A6Q2X0U9_ESOLU
MNPNSLFSRQQGGAFQAPSNTNKTSGMFQDFAQQAAPNPPQNVAFGQAATFGQSSAFSQPSVSGQTSAFGQTSSIGQGLVFGQSGRLGSTTATSTGLAPSMTFGQSPFGQPQPSTTTVSFSATQSIVQSKGFGTSEFSFKPSNEVLFKPIFSASPEPANTQPTPEQPFSGAVTTNLPSSSSMDSKGLTSSAFCLLTGAKSGPLGFSFSQPAAAPSIPAFTFAQPAALSSTNTSSISFGQKSAFGETKTSAPAQDAGGDDESTGEVTTFGRLGKGTKRKEEPADSSIALGKPPPKQDDQAGGDLPQPKRSSRGPAGGLFGRAMSGLFRSPANLARREAVKQKEPPAGWGEVEREDAHASIHNTEAVTKTPARRGQRGESTDSLGATSPTDATILQCKNVPPSLNRKDIIEKHFGRFGKVRRVFCRPHKNLAIVHFQDHASAAKAKKKGKTLHRHEVLLFWQRKKLSNSPLKKPSIAKSLQFDTEPQQDSAFEGQSSDHPVPSSLLHLIGQLAETAEDKYRLLEQRDKILRAERPKRTDLVRSFFVGTCPDMCPEKERYMRETRKQLSCFEVIPDTEKVDHVASIKEYSRSSADQEEPLPHELRPLPVLSMTMDYLVTQIMDQGHENYHDWYDFVWNRTRGIRKDITQQHLCDPLTVSLIEKCTRFHVHCAHHLCQEHMRTFDAKINNENMTKCLQSLKEMYQDLATRDVYCPREAEFRQYNVLLKLDVGDVLREVQQFREEVRNSPEVKFAVQAFAAFNSNNFVRFFKLVKSGSYLAGCLLHRYFNQVRGKALRTLNIAHTVSSQRSTIFPLEDLVRMLMFKDAGEATDFIQQFGLTVSDTLVELSRTAWQEPELTLPQVKSDVIVAKRAALVGEVVNGGLLPCPPQHVPICSFDANNRYRGEMPLAETSSTTGVFRTVPVAETGDVALVHFVCVFLRLATEEKTARVMRCSEEVCCRLVEETLDKEIFVLVENILKAELQRIQKYIKRWRDVVAVRRQLKRQMRGFPAAPCCVDPQHQLKALAPSAPSQPSMESLARGMVNLGNAGYMALSSTRLLKMRQEAIHQMRVHFYYQQLTLCITNALRDSGERTHKVHLSVKVPNQSKKRTSTLCKHLSPSIHNRLPKEIVLIVCVWWPFQASRGPLSEEGLSKMEEAQELQGTRALLMLLPAPSSGSEDQDVPLLSALLQLKQLQQANIWDCPLPLAILVPGLQDVQKLEEDLMLQTLVEDGLISEHTFVPIPETTSDLQGSEKVSEAVRWLLARAPAPSLVSCRTLVHFVETGLCREFSARLYGHRQDRAGARLAQQHPAPVINLYNAVLSFLADIVSSQQLTTLSWPPGEFALPDMRDLVPHMGWNSPQHLAWLRRAVLSLQIPSWNLPADSASWPQLCASIFQYAGQVSASRHSQPLLMSHLENLLERVRCSTTAAQDQWDANEGPSMEQIPWDEVVALCIDHKLKDWQPPDGPVCADAVTEDGEVLVYFSKEALKGFQPPAEWTEAVRLTHREKQLETLGPGGFSVPETVPKASLRLPIRQKLFQSLADGPEQTVASSATVDITHTPSPRELLPHKVLHGLQEERALSQRCEEQLQRWLEVEPLDMPSLPLFMPSTLLSMTNILAPIRTPAADADLEDPLEKVGRDWFKGAPISMTQRLKELDSLLLASREEELACSLKLNSLLHIVED